MSDLHRLLAAAHVASPYVLVGHSLGGYLVRVFNARYPAEVVGLDQSEHMVAQARRNFPDLRFEVGDARTFSLEEPFDAVFSNAVLHWLKPADAAVDRVWRALKPGGRFVAEFGGHGNVRHLCEAIHSSMEQLGYNQFHALFPWYYPE